MSLRDMCVLEPATAAPRKARLKIGGAGSRKGRALRRGSGFAPRGATPDREKEGTAAHGDLSPHRESDQPRERAERDCGGGYRSGERLRDEQADEQKFYKARAERIEFTASWRRRTRRNGRMTVTQLWNHAERAEKRKDAQLAREIEIALPHELTAQQREWLVKDFAREAFVRKGYAVDIAIHAPDKTSDERNHHAHLMVTMRRLGEDGFAAKKDPAMNKREQLGEWREQWAHLANRHLERHGHEARIDHRSLKEQGIEREAGIHLGYAANEMAQRGAQSDRMDALKAVMARNDIRVEMGKIDREVAALERAEKAQTRDHAPSPVPDKKEPKTERQAEPPRQHSEKKITPAPTITPAKPAAREAFTGKEPPRATQGAARAVGGVAGGATKIAAKALDGLASAFESLFGGGSAKVAEPRPELVPTPTKEGQAQPTPAPREPEPRHQRRSRRRRGVMPILKPFLRRSSSNARRVAKNFCATTGARFRRKPNAMRRSSATRAINTTEGEAGASARPTGAGRTSDGQGQQPQKSAGGQSHAAAGNGRAGAAAARVGQVVRLSGVRLSVLVDRQAEAKTAATIREEAEGSARQRRRMEGAQGATDADQGAEAWPCRRQASAATGRAHGAHRAAGQGVCRAGACGGRRGRRRMAGANDARFTVLPDAAGAQRLGGKMGRVSQRTGGARKAGSAGATATTAATRQWQRYG